MKSKKTIIKEQAAKLFRKKGYRATSMKEIAAEVGMEAASLYNHVKSKQEIITELLLTIAALFTKGMQEITSSALSPIEKLERLIGLHVRLTVDHTDAISIITGEWVHLEEPAYSTYKNQREAYESSFKSILDDCVKEGSLQPVNTDIALFSILSTLHWLYSWYNKHEKISPIDLEKQMIQCLLDGLRRKA